MEFLAYSFVFLFGLVVGSFLNCVIYRLEEGKSFLRGRSFCPRCKHVLSWQDLIPVFSFLLLRGKCRYCREKISWQYPLVEIATGIIFIFNFRISDFLLSFNIREIGYLNIVACFLVIIFVYDLKHYIIPDKVIYPAIATAGIYDLLRLGLDGGRFGLDGGRLGLDGGMPNLLISAFGAAGFFLVIVLVSQGRWMGVGDIKLAFLMGLVLGFPNILVSLFLAFSLGAIVGIGLILLGRKKLKSEVPFGPFLAAGTFLALFWGKDIASWYLNLILLE